MHGCGEAESNEPADAGEIGTERGLPHVGVIAHVVPEKKNDEDRGEVGAGDGSGNAGADDAEHGKSAVAKDEEIVAEGVDEIGGDEGEGDGADEVHSLEGAAKGEVKKKRHEAECQRVHIRAGKDGDVGGDAEAIEEMRERPDGGEEQGRNGKAEVDAIDEGVETVFEAAGAEGLGDEGVEADEEAFTEEGEDEEEAGTDADGSDGLGAVGEAANHHCVHDGHADPADFGEDERKGQIESGAKLGTQSGPGEHGE